MGLLKRLAANAHPPELHHELEHEHERPAAAAQGQTAAPPPVPATPANVATPAGAPPLHPAPSSKLTPPAPLTASEGRARELGLKGRIQQRLLEELDPREKLADPERLRQHIRELFDEVLTREDVLVGRNERDQLFSAILADIVGYGPIDPLLADESVTEIMVNGPNDVFVERKGKLMLTDVHFDGDEHVRQIIERIIAPLGRRCDESSPYVDARLPDGSRVHAIIPPLALNGPTVTIRKFSKKPLSMNDLIRFGSISPEAAEFLKAAVIARLNIIVSGGTGSGKTTLLNVLSSFIPADERIITCEDAAELQLMQRHWVRLESRKPNIEGKGAITIRELVINTLRMRPDRIVVGECRGGEALDMIQAMNTGHDGSLTTLHANSPKDALARLEVLVLMAGMDLPVRAIRQQVSSAVQLVAQIERMRDGSRRVTYLTEIQGMEGETIVTQDLFVFEQTGIDEHGKIIGQLKPTGLRPKFMQKIEDAGIHLAPNIFGAQDRLFH